MILIDTHVLLWTMGAPDRLGTDCKALIEQMSAEKAVGISAISGWELAMLSGKGRIILGMTASRWLAMAMERGGMRIVDINLDMAVEAGALAGDLHGDPCDRLLIATARHLDCRLITVDKAILAYGAQGHVRVVDGRR